MASLIRSACRPSAPDLSSPGLAPPRPHPSKASAIRRAPWSAACLAAVFLAVLPTAPAAAPPEEALRMTWQNCPLGGGVRTQEFNCGNDVEVFYLYCAFSTLEPIDQVVGLELVVDLQHSSAVIPDYWRLGPFPDCRHDALTAGLNFSGTIGCANPGFSSALVQDYIVGQPRGQASQARIKAVAFVPTPETRTLANDTTYVALRLQLTSVHTQFDPCDGCFDPACLVLNSILVRRVKGAEGGDITLTTPGAGDANWVYWRTDNGAPCSMVPVRNLTWGRVKSLYR